ncbi:cell division protein FtsK [Sphaerisporangium album]|uniref:Cell division protein FtsK n=1 Tax=Sphaerisporangium album TaxID=509200 RepID=A0A367EPP1_9ACTN|nr:FtsK/SpoIIIE domain-containing protein [Sphaerisporangium album]RCG20076.1 cell division protein FtsK [Sphaerisporangium album]
MLRKLPGTEVQNVVSTTPDTAVVWRPTVVRTPAIVVIVVWVWRLLVGLVKTIVRHPWACGLVAVAGGLCWLFGWRVAVLACSVACCGLAAWAALWPASFLRVVGWRVVSWGRWMWVYRRRWRGVVSVSGLAVNVGGRGYAPELVEVASDRWADRVTVRMLEGQSDQDYADRAPNIAHGFGAPSCRVSVPRPGWVVLTLPRADRLASVVAARPVPATASVGPVDVGLCEDGSPFALRVHGTHVLIAGATGAGKGSFLWSVVRGLLPARRAGLVELWALDPKRMELSYGLSLFDRYAARPEDCAKLLDDAVTVMQERADRYAGVRRNHVPTASDPFVLVIVDEVAFLTAYQGDKALKVRIQAALATLTTQGRAVGVGVMAALQDPRKDVLSIRNLFPDRIALRLDEPEQVDMVLGDGARDRGALADQIARDPSDPSVGAGVAYVRLENSPEPVRVRAGYVSDADIRQMVLLSMEAV